MTSGSLKLLVPIPTDLTCMPYALNPFALPLFSHRVRGDTMVARWYRWGCGWGRACPAMKSPRSSPQQLCPSRSEDMARDNLCPQSGAGRTRSLRAPPALGQLLSHSPEAREGWKTLSAPLSVKSHKEMETQNCGELHLGSC